MGIDFWMIVIVIEFLVWKNLWPAMSEWGETETVSPSTRLGTFAYSGNNTAVVEWWAERDSNSHGLPH